MSMLTITSDSFVAVTVPSLPCKMQVHDAPVYVTFTTAGTVTRGMLLFPGEIIPLAAGNAPRMRKASTTPPVVVFEVFG